MSAGRRWSTLGSSRQPSRARARATRRPATVRRCCQTQTWGSAGPAASPGPCGPSTASTATSELPAIAWTMLSFAQNRPVLLLLHCSNRRCHFLECSTLFTCWQNRSATLAVSTESAIPVLYTCREITASPARLISSAAQSCSPGVILCDKNRLLHFTFLIHHIQLIDPLA